MIAKLIASAPTRDEAAEILADELDFTAAWPVKTNAGFLVKALRHPRFLSGDVETGFIAATLESLVPEPSTKAGMWKLAALNLGCMFDEANSILADTQIGRAYVRTPVTNAHLVGRLML